MNQPLVSVYMPTKNRFNLACRAIDSVLNQTYENIELLVVDDGSDEEEFLNLKNKYENIDNVTILRNEISKGACASRNKAISLAKGEFITGLDDDDYFQPHRLEHLLSEYSEKFVFIFDHNFKCKLQPCEIFLSDMLLDNIVGNQVFTKKENIIQAGMFDESLPAWQDYDLWLRMLKHKNAVAKRITGCSQIIDTNHELNRISANKTKLNQALKIFFEKHQDLYSDITKVGRQIQYMRHYNDLDYLNVTKIAKGIKVPSFKIKLLSVVLIFQKTVQIITPKKK
jgi:glycosyltransferase involved in cell wall biosynthesis